MIDKITSLYGYVVKSHADSNLETLHETLLGIVYHLAANDENCGEMHKYCQVGESSFCQHNKAVAFRTPIPKHPRCISLDCRDRVLEILAPYTCVEFLDKVQGGNTSNLNENLHGMIWNHVSKVKLIELSLMKLGAALAVVRFNDDFVSIQKIIDKLSVNCFININNLVREIDNDRHRYSVRICENSKRRWALKQAKRSSKRVGMGYQSGNGASGCLR